MKFQEKVVTSYGNSKVINTSDLEKGDKVFLLDKEMLDFIRGIKDENGKN